VSKDLMRNRRDKQARQLTLIDKALAAGRSVVVDNVNATAADRAALVEVIQRVSALVCVVPEIRDLALNPVKVLMPGRGAVVVDARICVAPAGPV
jgi:hypothetical protein